MLLLHLGCNPLWSGSSQRLLASASVTQLLGPLTNGKRQEHTGSVLACPTKLTHCFGIGFKI